MLTRRNLLRACAGVAGGAAAMKLSHADDTTDSSTLRVAFLTDIHLPAGRPEIAERVAKLIDSIQARPNSPDLFVFGGDNVMAVDGDQSDDEVHEQFDLWNRTVTRRLKTPFLSVIGNHDIWWNAPGKKSAPADPKRLATEHYRMPHRYFSRSVGGWKFILLDCYQQDGCRLDERQWSWLESEVRQENQPVCVVTHAPVLSVTHFLEPSVDTGKGYEIPGSWLPKGVTRFRELFRAHPSVRLALSGHMHTVDRVEVDTTAYVCGGAVSGAWWDGEYLGFPPLWIELILSSDGTWSHEVHPWG
ncbi:Calcineurin-like phosphoesterase [Maioricimonas rarisocia]|uniref:Calcineurin-like phosphoesterase n=1 Tax=Maioricimonas rarisocia TaxID=2528026 RepID=A0A517ZB79_9PLAN|nr:metallophosphoesterase [Maioricimonas rarisocia]QDU39752.1 Calcineurin-like phosphoesterase [Maioricimonas rarisocia]